MNKPEQIKKLKQIKQEIDNLQKTDVDFQALQVIKMRIHKLIEEMESNEK